MIKIHRYAATTDSPPSVILALPYETRKKSRFTALSAEGEKLGLILPRGRVLRDGTLLEDETGRVIAVKASSEQLSVATAVEAHQLTLAAYHLGNRHVPVQIGKQRLSYQHDPVLDDMVSGLGLSVSVEFLPFEPEEGAYAPSSTHGHSH